MKQLLLCLIFILLAACGTIGMNNHTVQGKRVHNEPLMCLDNAELSAGPAGVTIINHYKVKTKMRSALDAEQSDNTASNGTSVKLAVSKYLTTILSSGAMPAAEAVSMAVSHFASGQATPEESLVTQITENSTNKFLQPGKAAVLAAIYTYMRKSQNPNAGVVKLLNELEAK